VSSNSDGQLPETALERVEPPPEKLHGNPVRDWLSLLFSLLALGISSVTAYWSIIRQIDDVRLMVTRSPSFAFDSDKNQIKIHTEQILTYINLGNRPVAINGIRLWINQPNIDLDKNEPRNKCFDSGPFVWVAADTDPVVLNPVK
jgi:hypothetical protein